VIGCGGTASSYVPERLRHGQKSFQSIIGNNIYRDHWLPSVPLMPLLAMAPNGLALGELNVAACENSSKPSKL